MCQGLGFAIVAQLLTLLLSELILDGGHIFRCCLAAIVAHWIIALIIWVRRRSAPTKVDLILVRAGCILIIAGGLPVAAIATFVAGRLNLQ